MIYWMFLISFAIFSISSPFKFTEDGTKPKAARDLCAIAIKDMLISELGAAADLGRQLAKAETAIKLGLEFQQDDEVRLND